MLTLADLHQPEERSGTRFHDMMALVSTTRVPLLCDGNRR